MTSVAGGSKSDEEEVQRLFSLEDNNEVGSKEIREVFRSVKTKSTLKTLACQHPSKAVALAKQGDCSIALIGLIDENEPLKPVVDTFKSMAKNPKDDDELQFAVDALSIYISIKQVPFDEVDVLMDVCAPYLTRNDKCWSAFARVYNKYRVSDAAKLEELVEQELDILNAKEDYAAIFKIVGFVFVVKNEQGKKYFFLDSVQDSIKKVNQYSSPMVIKEGLSLLSLLCTDEDLRKTIATQFLPVLIHGVNSTEVEVQELSTLVIIKTWDFSQPDLQKSLTIEDLYNTITKKFTKTTIEGLTYLSLKPSIRKKLRNDDEVIFDLTKKLDKIENKSQDDLFGSLVILANLTTIEEKNEVSELKKHAQKGLENDSQEDPDEVMAFQEDILERNVLPFIAAREKELSPNSISQAVKLIYNLSKQKQNRSQILKQAGIKILFKVLDMDGIPREIKIFAYRSISNILLTTDPQSIFEIRKAQYALFLFLKEDSLPEKDQLQALISLTNANAVDNGALPDDQWEQIDHYLTNENTLIRRSAIELVCNLVQHKDGVAAVYNFQKPASKKRFDLLVQYTLLDDVKSQCSAVAALSFGVTFPFIAEEVIKDKTLLNHLFTILNEQYREEELLERVLFVLYYLIFYSEENTSVMNSLATDGRFKKGIELVIKNIKRDSEPFEMALEISKLVKFK